MRWSRFLLALAAVAMAASLLTSPAGIRASESEKPVMRDYARVLAPPAPARQSAAQAEAKSAGCLTCHARTEAATMHVSPAVILGCTDCHGGNAAIRGNPAQPAGHPDYAAARDAAHVLPRYPESWHFPSSANPRHAYTLLNREAPEFVRFVNPGDYRVAREACGSCHLPTVEAAERSIMATGAMLWGGAAYNNGIAPLKNYMFGEAYTRDGRPAKVVSPGSPPGSVTRRQAARGALAALYPLPPWNVIPPGDVFRVFEDGGRTNSSAFAEVGLPNASGSIQRLEEPGRPDLKQSNRGPGTGLRVAIPVLNIHKTRLNDPFMWFMGTNDQPGDYRHSGCTGCHVVYANDREPRHSLTYAQFGRDGQTATADPAIAGKSQPPGAGHGGLLGDHGGHSDHGGQGGEKESGHPIGHVFTRAIPTAQCMTCHMHQPNVFVNTYLGYTMWDYEADAPFMWPGPENRAPRPEGMSAADHAAIYGRQHYPDAEKVRAINQRNPEGAAPRGLWGDVDFLRNVYDLNPRLRDTQFADYHGHGWNFRAIFKRDRAGNLLDENGSMATWGTDTAHIVDPDDPEKWRRADEGQFVQPGANPGKAVHMMDIHAEKGMQCADCHFAQDSHGNGLIQGEVANAVEIGCKDCHGTADAYPTLLTSGPAAPPKGNNLALLRNPDGQRRFEWIEDGAGRRTLVQRSILDPGLVWQVRLTKDTTDPASPHFNARSARAKLMSRSGARDGSFAFGPGIAPSDRAHKDSEIACFSCHLSWTTSCGGCHLPIEANWKSEIQHFEGGETRNFATYNPQVARDEMFQLGRHQGTKGNIIAPVRSSSALVLSSTNANRERIYVQQPPVSAPGFSSQAFAPHFPHTVRTRETKTCTDCHVSEAEDNNAILAQTLLLGTNFVNFVGLNAWTGLETGFEAVRVTEWDEPQAVIGSYLQRYAYPDFWRLHVERNGRELKNWTRTAPDNAVEQFRNVTQGTDGRVGCLQLRGEFMYAAEGSGGLRVHDVAAVANKGFSDAILNAPFPGDAHVETRNATCVALPTNQPIAPTRNTPLMREANQEQPFLPIYNYAVVTDSEEGLILVNINTFADGEFRNNRIRRAVTWNPDGVLNGARYVTLAGEVAYIVADRGLVVVDLANPLKPKLAAVRQLADPRAAAIQFRYLWVTDRDGVKLFDVTDLRNPVAVPEAAVAMADARRLYVARTYLYVAAKGEGLAIIDVTRPRAPRLYLKTTLDGRMTDVEDVIVGSTNASLFAYVADGMNGLKVLQLTSPDSQRNFYGFSPAPQPELIAWARTASRAISLSKGLDRDRAVDETGGQIAVFGRLGSRPFTRPEMERLFMTPRGIPFKVNDEVDMRTWRPR